MTSYIFYLIKFKREDLFISVYDQSEEQLFKALR